MQTQTNNKTVDVIIPTYNRADVIVDAVNSVLSQTHQEINVIVVDDGSTDQTKQVVESLNEERVHYFYKTNGGAPSARNLGLTKAQGEYVAFLDSDDYWPKDYLEVMVKRLEQNPNCGAAYCAITLVCPDGTEVKSYKRPAGRSGWLTVDLFKSGFVWPTASLFRKNVWLNQFFDEFLCKSYDDGDAFLRLSVNTQFLFVSDVEAFHTISGDSIAVQTGVACTRILVLERFYYRLGGDQFIPRATAMRRLSHAYRKVAKNRCQLKAKTAAIKLYLKAIKYWPFDIRLYIGLFRTIFIIKDSDSNWQMPAELGMPSGTNRFLN